MAVVHGSLPPSVAASSASHEVRRALHLGIFFIFLVRLSEGEFFREAALYL